ncbi:MAG: peptidoglycan-binding protein [Thalassobium sp.]|nr:MAG: peptidoglycan-binding protein [Thalassobium sp.]
MKRIAIFIDGTWNRPDAQHPTNVVRLARCVRHRADGGMAQMVLYSPGVGSGRGNNALARRMDRTLGGALGWGLTDIIADAYRNLVFAYEPGDEVCVFGFSRGAFAARSLVGMIRSCGIAPRAHLARLPEALARYISRDPATHPGSDDSHAWREGFAPATATSRREMAWRDKHGKGSAGVIDLRIAYLGVWDTVSALGLPAFIPFADRFNRQYRFHDAKLSSMVLAARHAIALDEKRRTFPSYPWDNMPELNEEYEHFVPTYMQQWFAGNHGSVGGGGSRTGLSSIALNWVAMGAERAGLAIDWQEFDRVAYDFDPLDPLDNKFGPVGLSGALLNLIERDRAGPADLSDVSVAAIDRFRQDDSYRPKSLDRVYHQLFGMPDEQYARMRAARVTAEGGDTHRLGQISRPR